LQVPFPGNQLLLEHLITAFPQKFNRQLLHFRFKREDPQHGYVWADIRNPKDSVPAFKGVVMAKVLCLADLNTNKRKSRLRRKVNADHGSEGAQASAKFAQTVGRNMNQHSSTRNVDHETHENDEDEYEEEAPPSQQQRHQAPASAQQSQSAPAAPVAPAPAKPPSSSAKSNPVAQPPPQARPTSASLFDDDEPAASRPTNAKPSLAADMLDSGAADMINFGDSPRNKPAKVASAKGPANGTTVDIDEKSAGFGTNGLTRDELKDRRAADIAAKVAAAKEFKDDCDEKARQSAEEVEVAKAKHDKNLDGWAANNKEKRNVRTLLTTMHTVLWPDSGWKPIGLGDVIEASKVPISILAQGYMLKLSVIFFILGQIAV
jgi:hypothetical protein